MRQREPGEGNEKWRHLLRRVEGAQQKQEELRNSCKCEEAVQTRRAVRTQRNGVTGSGDAGKAWRAGRGLLCRAVRGGRTRGAI